MNQRFRALIDAVEPRFDQLMAMRPVTYETLPRDLPKRAVYLFSEGDDHLYVGRTSNLRNRLRGHCAPSSRHFSAVFAYRIASESTQVLRSAYGIEGATVQLVEDPLFNPAFSAAMVRIGRMDLRYVEESDPVRQALLEIYVATALQTRYNDFDRSL